MIWIVKNLWLIPVLPLLAAGLIAVSTQPQRKRAATLAIGSMGLAFLLALCALAATLKHDAPGGFREVCNFNWFQFGEQWLQLGWVLDPLTAVMLVMVTFVGALIFIFSVGYMAHDENFTRFFCFLSLFAAGMLGVVIANSLLLLFMSWEIVGLTSYLLIGFWYHKPSAAAAAKKAFITTRIGDLGLLIGMVWLYAKTGTLNFYDGGNGCLEIPTLAKSFPVTTFETLSLLGIALLIFVGAMGKSGQVPLHVWLPDAMEGPTPVSALIHAATMVAAGVFLVARMFALMKPDWSAIAGPNTLVTIAEPDATLVITWVGAITAFFAATIAVAQNDIKRILAYSTVSQLGYMMMGLGVGGVAVGMFHLITHAFFKALLFLGSGSVIHGCHEEQDIRHMGGLKKFMPVTFATYAVGMLALAGFPVFFAGFWSKDAILHAAHGWPISHWPFYLGAAGALLTAFYMTRQVALVFFGQYRSAAVPGRSGHDAEPAHKPSHGSSHSSSAAAGGSGVPHESPAVMTVPLVILAVFAVLLGFLGTPVWPWFQTFLGQAHETSESVLPLMVTSSLIVFIGLGLGWWLYGKRRRKTAAEPDVLEVARPDIFALLKNKYFVDELYEHTVIRFNAWFAAACDFFDRWVWGGVVLLVAGVTIGLAWLYRVTDEFVVNLGFDAGCEGIRRGGGEMSRLHTGRVQTYLRVLGVALVVLILLLVWGRKA
ncbi:MAG TPA: NADH-quinone oxidoreductase subunit L [Verrucomicrobiae bacterium]|nr:NADH-quinone oxidoreductase subunit L [Verrucomicrobiae bacterium]